MATVINELSPVKKPAKVTTRKPATRLRKVKGNGAAHADGHNDAAHDGFDGHDDQPAPVRRSATAKARQSSASSLVTRGKDLLTGDAGGVAAAAGIIVGAALIEIELIPGLLIGAGAILLGKLFPGVGEYVRPAVKGALRAGLAMTHKAREVMAEASEQVHDLMAEVKHEQQNESHPKAAKPAHVPVRTAVATGDHLPVH
jgi:hypothetical protein